MDACVCGVAIRGTGRGNSSVRRRRNARFVVLGKRSGRPKHWIDGGEFTTQLFNIDKPLEGVCLADFESPDSLTGCS